MLPACWEQSRGDNKGACASSTCRAAGRRAQQCNGWGVRCLGCRNQGPLPQKEQTGVCGRHLGQELDKARQVCARGGSDDGLGCDGWHGTHRHACSRDAGLLQWRTSNEQVLQKRLQNARWAGCEREPVAVMHGARTHPIKVTKEHQQAGACAARHACGAANAAARQGPPRMPSQQPPELEGPRHGRPQVVFPACFKVQNACRQIEGLAGKRAVPFAYRGHPCRAPLLPLDRGSCIGRTR